MIRYVTLTGADDSVKPQDLIDISKRYPFVEWGILISADNFGEKRFPSQRWIQSLASELEFRNEKINLALHICGKFCRDFMSQGRKYFIDAVGPGNWTTLFSRVQFNTHGAPAHTNLTFIHDFFKYNATKEFIIQLDHVNNPLIETLVASGLRNVTGLFDESHGLGELPKKWPSPWLPGVGIGYAGGLGPDNVSSQIVNIHMALANISFQAPDYWIDMETRVRSNDGKQFDLSLCQSVLRQAEPWFESIASN